MMNVTHLSRCYVKKLTFQDIKWGTLLSLEWLKSLQRKWRTFLLPLWLKYLRKKTRNVPLFRMAEIFTQKKTMNVSLSRWLKSLQRKTRNVPLCRMTEILRQKKGSSSLQNGWKLCKEKRRMLFLQIQLSRRFCF